MQSQSTRPSEQEMKCRILKFSKLSKHIFRHLGIIANLMNMNGEEIDGKNDINIFAIDVIMARNAKMARKSVVKMARKIIHFRISKNWEQK